MKQMSLEDLGVQLRIKEDNKKSEKASYKTMESKANIIEGGKSSKKRKHSEADSSLGNKKFKGKCYVCGKNGHMAKDCRNKKVQDKGNKKKNEAHVTEDELMTDEISEMNLSAVVTEANLAGNP